MEKWKEIMLFEKLKVRDRSFSEGNKEEETECYYCKKKNTVSEAITLFQGNNQFFNF
jgi:hypothetical protein